MLQKDAKILQAVSTFKIKDTDTKNVYDFYYRLCANGSNMTKGKDFNESHSPVGLYSSVRIMLALAVAFNLTLYGIDVDNLFQCTTNIDDDKNPPLYVTMPLLYMAWFRKYFHHVKIPGCPPYVLQCLKLI